MCPIPTHTDLAAAYAFLMVYFLFFVFHTVSILFILIRRRYRSFYWGSLGYNGEHCLRLIIIVSHGQWSWIVQAKYETSPEVSLNSTVCRTIFTIFIYIVCL